MKSKLIYLGLFSFSTLLPLMPGINKIANAACVAVDVAPQIGVTKGDASVQQSSSAEANFAPDCFGSFSSVTDTQVGVSGGPIDQTRNSQHNLGNVEANPYGLSGPNLFIPVNPQVNTTVPDVQPDNYTHGLGY